jgi:ABC-2 type transport system ATP-binding protein
MSQPVIAVEGLRKSYGALEALRGVDLSFERGGLYGLLGPNGAGKTTFVETLEGLRTPSAGRVSVLGMDPSVASRDVRERIGVQLQSTSLQPDLTAREVLRMFGALYRRRRPAAEVLASVGLSDKADTRTANLSGGQKQRLALALALLHDPEIVLLDEPTTGLDPVARRGLHDVVRGLRSEGRTVLLTTHYIEEAELLCDRVVVLNGGRVVADGTPFELLERASGETTLWIAAEGPFDPQTLVAAGASLAGREKDHWKFVTRDPAAAVVALGDVLRAGGVKLVDLRMRRPTLEDVYLELVGPAARENGATVGEAA